MAHDILVVDDEPDIRMLLAGILEDEGYSVRQAGTDREALDTLAERQPSLIILDVWLEGSRLDGIGVLNEIKRDHPPVPVLMISGHGTVETAVAAMKQGAYDFIEKPFKADRLLMMIERAIEQASLKREVEELRTRVGGSLDYVGNSQLANDLRRQIERVAPTNSRALITGPSGAGKELVARLLHARSRRAEGPLLFLNCANIHPDRFEEELFGLEPQSPGEARKVGLLEQAHGGTLVLDEVGDMPLATQPKIVRVLQEQRFRRVGSDRTVSVDVRILSITGRDLREAMSEGQFREDLFYRLNVIEMAVPGLAERLEDIPDLIGHFMERIVTSSGLAPRELSEDALAVMQTYGWPGNVRQLRNVVEWLMIMGPGEPGEPISSEQLPPDLVSNRAGNMSGERRVEIMALELEEARRVFEIDYLTAQLNRFGGNVSRTAQFVGMERSALHRKLKALGIYTGKRKDGTPVQG